MKLLHSCQAQVWLYTEWALLVEEMWKYWKGNPAAKPKSTRIWLHLTEGRCNTKLLWNICGLQMSSMIGSVCVIMSFLILKMGYKIIFASIFGVTFNDFLKIIIMCSFNLLPSLLYWCVRAYFMPQQYKLNSWVYLSASGGPWYLKRKKKNEDKEGHRGWHWQCAA